MEECGMVSLVCAWGLVAGLVDTVMNFLFANNIVKFYEYLIRPSHCE